ncbi:tripartite tricarboxylate transporter permease [Mycobacterium sp. NPDC051804]|uniref:tripartite tricarboxylate transporter permease n=1 Tax=Mycobacterium sp. NPDC051804 TaxID=3364295 RepID=UPI0037ACF4D8
MDFTAFLDGFALVVEPHNLLYCLIGVLIGMIIGVLPGLGPAATIAILLPITYTIDPVSAIIMLAGIYYGAQYGGTITSVLLRLPGEASSVVTVFDGFALAKQGKAGTALGIAAIGSFVGATISIIGLTLLAPVVASVALDFGPPEYAALALLGVLLVATIGSGNKLKALIAGTVGLLLATVGRDSFTGASRFTFDSLQLADGIDFVVVAMGLFGVGEILYNLEQRHGKKHVPAEVGNVWPSRKDLKQCSGAMGRGSIIGFVLGVLPGGGAVLSSIVAYATEKRRSKTPERFGRGAVEGVAAPETANNAAATSSFIPLLTIGLPANATMAMLFGALLILGISPGPQLVDEHPDVFWGVINSMYIGNILLLILSIPLVGLFVRILKVRPAILAPITALITILGVYTINNSVFDIYVMVAFGIVGYLMKKAGFDPGPLVLAFVLGSIIESSTRRSLLIFGGDPTGFVTRPISGVILAVFVLLIVAPMIRTLLKRRASARVEPAPGVGKVDAHRGTGRGGVTGENGGDDVVVLGPDPVDVTGVGERVGVTQPHPGKHDHHRSE